MRGTVSESNSFQNVSWCTISLTCVINNYLQLLYVYLEPCSWKYGLHNAGGGWSVCGSQKHGNFPDAWQSKRYYYHFCSSKNHCQSWDLLGIFYIPLFLHLHDCTKISSWLSGFNSLSYNPTVTTPTRYAYWKQNSKWWKKEWSKRR